MPWAAMARIRRQSALDLGCVEAGVDLIEQQELGIRGKALGELQPLAIGQRELRGGRVGIAGKPGEFQAFHGAGAGGRNRARASGKQSAGGDIVEDAHARKRLHHLEGAADTKPGDAKRGQAIDALACKRDLARVGRLHPGDDIDQGGLAGAVRPDQSDDLAGHEREAHAVERDEPAEMFAHAGERQQGTG